LLIDRSDVCRNEGWNAMFEVAVAVLVVVTTTKVAGMLNCRAAAGQVPAWRGKQSPPVLIVFAGAGTD